MMGPDGVQQTAFMQVDGNEGKSMPPMPIGPAGAGREGIPNAMIVAGHGMPGQPTAPIAGVNAPVWGMPHTGTPIGLPGPTHLPYGGPASLKSHTVYI